MSGQFGWSLPPGVTTRMIEDAQGVGYEQPRCWHCKSFLPAKPDRTERWEDALDCDGTITVYHEEYDERLVAILGEDYRGKTYPVTVADCGVDRGRHAPHRDVMDSGEFRFWTCRRCGKETKDR